MKPKLFMLTAILAATSLAVLTGCGSKPIDELKMARTSMDLARDKEAPEYDPDRWDRARTQWEEGNTLIQMGRYGEARDVLTDSIGNFNIARDEAVRRIESLKLEINALKVNTETELTNLEKAGASAKATPLVRNRIDRAIPLIEEKISAMNADYDAKEYLRSRMTGNEAMRYMQDLEKRFGLTR